MTTKTSTGTIIGALALVAALAALASGCGAPRAGEAEASPEAAATDVDASLQEAAAEAAGREAVLAGRELAVAAREDELARAQAVVASSLRALERRLDAEEEPAAAPEPEPVVDDAPEPAPAAAPFPRRMSASETPAPAPEPASLLVELPAATALAVELDVPASSETSVAGDAVTGRLAEDVLGEGLVVIPAGARVSGEVAEAVKQKKIGGQARLALRFDRLELPTGEVVPIDAWLVAEGEKQTEKDAVTIGGATAGGAILGRVLKDDDRDKGTVVGAILGAAIGTAVAAKNKADPIDLAPGAIAVATLEAPVTIAVTDPGARAVAQGR